MNENKGIWIGVTVVVLVALGLWWLSASQVISFPSMTGKTADNTSVSAVDRSSSDVASIATSISGASIFGSWLSSTGVASSLTGKGPYTIFVPTDAAIAQLKAGTFTSLSAAEQKRFVQYHVVSGRALDVDAVLSGTIQALSKDMLNFSNINNIPMVNSGIVISQYSGSNGIVYVINTALQPPKKTQ